MSDHPETDAHVASLKKTPSCFFETAFSEKMEIDRNRWRSVAEQAEKALEMGMKATAAEHVSSSGWLKPGCYTVEGAKELRMQATTLSISALSAFDSLRKEKL